MIKNIIHKNFLYITMLCYSIANPCEANAQKKIKSEQVINSRGEKLIFQDDFSELDLSKNGGGEHRWFNSLWYKNQVNANNFEQNDGFLRLKTDIYPLNTVQSTSLTTMSRVRGGSSRLFHYGFFEAKMRFKPGTYNWPAFWLLSRDVINASPNNERSFWCEIDIFEGGSGDLFQGTVHDWRNYKSISNDNSHRSIYPEIKPEEWHIYGLRWSKNTISWFFDGKLMLSAKTPIICQKQKMFMVLSAQKRVMGINSENLDVDWVRVYE